ncbi:hypothetical protein [Porphyromonas gingivicanis]|uniref:hypothetical protein n=1 Tax=Porphyromonas gingivicanis TaxID=266762 RepID=UPI0011DDD0E4|nr:hypothetical protein [Porphyromonas gingivicanis]
MCFTLRGDDPSGVHALPKRVAIKSQPSEETKGEQRGASNHLPKRVFPSAQTAKEGKGEGVAIHLSNKGTPSKRRLFIDTKLKKGLRPRRNPLLSKKETPSKRRLCPLTEAHASAHHYSIYFARLTT